MKTAIVLVFSILGLGACTDPADNFIGVYSTTMTLGTASAVDTLAIGEGQTADLILSSQQLGSMKATIIGDTSFSIDQQQITVAVNGMAVPVTVMGQGTVSDGVLAASGQLSSATAAFALSMNGSRQ